MEDVAWYNKNREADMMKKDGGMYGHVKVPIPIIKSEQIEVNSVCCYPVKCTNGIVYYAGERRGEENKMHAQLIKTQWGDEINFRIAGEYHYERLSYNKRPFKEWSTWLELSLPLDEIDNLINFLMEIKESKKEKKFVGQKKI